MATRDFANITDALVKIFYDDITNQINRAIVLAQLLPVRMGTGQNIQWDVKFGAATPTTAVIADGADVSVFNSDVKVPAVLQFGTYHDAFEVTGKAAAAAAASGNPDQLSDLFGDELNDSSQRLARAIAADVYIGSGAVNTIHGLTAAAGPLATSGVYAGIDKAVQTQWQGNQVAVGGPITFAAIRQLRRTIYTASGMKNDIFICDAEQHEKLGLLYGAERRYVDEVRLRGGDPIRLDGGYQVLEFDGIPVIEDAQCPSGTLLALNTNFLYLSQMPDPLTVMNQSVGHADLMGTEEEQYGEGPIGLEARILPLAKNGDKYPFGLYCYPQLVSRRNNVHGSLTGLT